VDLATFNAAPPGAAEEFLLSCCASRRLAARIASRRPYRSAALLEGAVTREFGTLTWNDVAEALAAHPRIGARVSGQSAAEQSGVTDDSRAALATANAEYERRFGHVFLICAAGLAGDQMLTALRERLNNNPFAERLVVSDELLKITLLRLRKGLGLQEDGFQEDGSPEDVSPEGPAQ
jgi:2-oxo-4-hydroxy-4-carboxy-5-ureidoimidazoline decarboxylase